MPIEARTSENKNRMSHQAVIFWFVLVFVSEWTLGQSGVFLHFGDAREFQPGNQTIYRTDCVAGPVVSNLVILPDTFQCQRFQDQRWIWPRKSGASISMPIEFPEEFSFEFTASTFADGCPYVSLQFHSEEPIEVFETGTPQNISKGGLVRAITSCSEARFGASIEPTDWDNTVIGIPVAALESYRIAIRVRQGQLDFFMGGKHVASQPFSPDKPIVAFSLRFNRKFETIKPYPEAPALVTDIRIAAYSERARGVAR